MAVNAAVARAWDGDARPPTSEWQNALGRLPDGDPADQADPRQVAAAAALRARLGPTPRPSPAASTSPPGLGETTAPHFPISHRLAWPDAGHPTGWVPLHLVGAGVALDTKTAR